ncbi:MAG: glycerol-3-phosphate acyltransferase [Acidimicrobiia bacterium]
MKDTTRAVAVVGLAYLAGAIPFSNLMAHARARVDLRTVGSGTVSGSGLYEVAGVVPLALAGSAELAAGAIGPLLAGPDRPVLSAVAAAAAVSGHNWSVFLRGAGGRGIAPALGAMAVRDWPGMVPLLAGITVGRLTANTGLGGFVGALAVPPTLAETRGRNGAAMGVAVIAPMLIKRVLGNRRLDRPNRKQYLTRLVFDRDEMGPPR